MLACLPLGKWLGLGRRDEREGVQVVYEYRIYVHVRLHALLGSAAVGSRGCSQVASTASLVCRACSRADRVRADGCCAAALCTTTRHSTKSSSRWHCRHLKHAPPSWSPRRLLSQPVTLAGVATLQRTARSVETRCSCTGVIERRSRQPAPGALPRGVCSALPSALPSEPHLPAPPGPRGGPTTASAAPRRRKDEQLPAERHHGVADAALWPASRRCS
jgi:hypothetical protein